MSALDALQSMIFNNSHPFPVPVYTDSADAAAIENCQKRGPVRVPGIGARIIAVLRTGFTCGVFSSFAVIQFFLP